MTLILSETFAPPRMTTKGRAGFSSSSPRNLSSLSINNPAAHWPPRFATTRATPSVEACPRWAAPKASFTYTSATFGAAHRGHASTEGVARVVAKRGGQCAAGLLMERELTFLGDELVKPARAFVVILGGAKV